MIFWLILVGPKTTTPRNHEDFEVSTLFDFYSAEEEVNECNAYPTAFQYLRGGYINCSPVCSPLF